MIQRIQTIFLLLAALISVLLLYLPVYEMQSFGTATTVPTRFTIASSAILLILNGAIGIFSFLGILLFKRRNLQIRLCNLLLLLCCILMGLLFFVADTFSSGDQKVQYLYGSYLPILQVIFIFIATKFIKRDEALVRSSDRLR